MAIDQPPAVEAVVVQAARLPPTAGEAAFSVVHIDAEALQTRPRLDEALTNTPGVSLFRRTSSLGANPTTQGISLRSIAGSGASRALVTLDGVPQNDPFGGWVIWTGIPTSTLEGARVVRGAGAGPYGAGALTGTIALDERASLPGGVAGQAEVGSRGYWRGDAAVDAPVGPVRVLVTGAGEHSDGWTPVEAGRRGAADVPLSLDDWNGSVRVLADAGKGTLALRAATFTEKRSAGLVGANSKVTGDVLSATYAVQPSGGALGWRVQGWYDDSNLVNTSVAVAANRATTTPANNQYHTPAHGYGFNAAIRRATSTYSWEIGVDGRAAVGETQELFRVVSNDFTRTRVAGGRTMVGGVYAEASRTTADWLFTGNVRLDGWRTYDAKRIERDRATGALTLDNRPADRDGVTPTARAGVVRTLEGGWSLRSAAYAGFRPATLNELHRPFRVGNDVTEANAALKPERLYGVEAGTAWRGAGGSFNVGVFYNRLNDAIANVTIGVGPATFPIAGLIPAGGVLRQRQNAGSVDAYGIEAEAEWKLAPTVTVDLGGGYTHAKVDGGASAPQLTGLRPAQTPRVSAQVGVSWKVIAPLSLRADLHYEGLRFDDDLNTRRLAAGADVDLRADWKVTGPVSAFVAVENVFDANLQTAITADGVRSYAAPRLWRVGLTLRR